MNLNKEFMKIIKIFYEIRIKEKEAVFPPHRDYLYREFFITKYF